jgi:hypothetical protein
MKSLETRTPMTGQTIEPLSLKKISRFGGAYSLYLAIVFLFDYIYYPWLAIRFKHLMVFPLYVSIFLVSWAGYYLYEFFQEDVFFTEKIHAWLVEPSATGFWSRLKRLIVSNPRGVFAAVSAWWSPLHAYVFFRRGKAFELPSFLKTLALGSLVCALFWGIVAESIIFLWSVLRGLFV